MVSPSQKWRFSVQAAQLGVGVEYSDDLDMQIAFAESMSTTIRKK